LPLRRGNHDPAAQGGRNTDAAYVNHTLVCVWS
jgi:hypothetical protein